ncbi:MAG: AzlD domain-containing protein [Kerstersia sp.]
MMENVPASYAYGVIAVLVLCSFISRSGYMLFGDHLPLPDMVRQALRYAPAAALTAIIVPELLPWAQGAGPVLDLRLFAGLSGIAIFLRTRNTVFMILGGMVALWGLRALFL